MTLEKAGIFERGSWTGKLLLFGAKGVLLAGMELNYYARNGLNASHSYLYRRESQLRAKVCGSLIGFDKVEYIIAVLQELGKISQTAVLLADDTTLKFDELEIKFSNIGRADSVVVQCAFDGAVVLGPESAIENSLLDAVLERT